MKGDTPEAEAQSALLAPPRRLHVSSILVTDRARDLEVALRSTHRILCTIHSGNFFLSLLLAPGPVLFMVRPDFNFNPDHSVFIHCLIYSLHVVISIEKHM